MPQVTTGVCDARAKADTAVREAREEPMRRTEYRPSTGHAKDRQVTMRKQTPAAGDKVPVITVVVSSGGAPLHKAGSSRMTTPKRPGTASSDRVETRLGTLTFVDGFPDPYPNTEIGDT
jgi:hypothetical protein